MASGGYRPALGVDQYLATAVAGGARSDTQPGQSADLRVGTDFPIVCETCLGPNPYVRMIKQRFGEKLCKISSAPMQSFRWKAGPQGRFKETIVCREVAVEKNICQACLTDMTFGVPVGVRDALLKAGGGDDVVGGYAAAKSNANQAHFYAQQRRAIDEGGSSAAAVQQLEPSRELLSLARSIEAANARSGTAFRNLPKICSFWLAGTCTRVGKGKQRGTCPFRPCCGLFKFPELAASHPTECAALVDDLRQNGAGAVMLTCPDDVRQAIKEAISGNKDEAIRNRVAGKDDVSGRYVGRARSSVTALAAPADESLKTLWVGGFDPSLGLTEADLVDAFYAFGELAAIRLTPASAFVEYATREAAEAAAAAKFRNLRIRGVDLALDWARPRPASPRARPRPRSGPSSRRPSSSGPRAREAPTRRPRRMPTEEAPRARSPRHSTTSTRPWTRAASAISPRSAPRRRPRRPARSRLPPLKPRRTAFGSGPG